MTTRLYLDICEGLTSTRSLSDIARQNCVTEAIVQSVLDVVDFEQPSTLPQTLCIDEFKGSAGIYDSARKRWITDKFHCNISDGDAGCIIDILPQITLEQLMPYFFSFDLAQRQKVKYFGSPKFLGVSPISFGVSPTFLGHLLFFWGLHNKLTVSSVFF